MSVFEIVKGDYGNVYEGIVKGVDYSSYTATITVWNSSKTVIIKDAHCTMDYIASDTHVYYTVSQDDFANITSGTYVGMIKFTANGVVEHTLKFSWKVYDGPPVST